MPELPSPYDKPFVVEIEHGRQAGHLAVPRSRLIVTPALRDSGLLASIPPEDAKTLLFVITYLHASGHIYAAAPQVADAMGTSEAKARDRLRRLAGIEWNGGPIVAETRRESGLDTFSPSDDIVGRVVFPPEPEEEPAALPVASREEVVETSRKAYSNPRSEVELGIAMRSGWELPDGATLPDGDAGIAYLATRLLKIGVPDNEARLLLNAYPAERIFRQCQWLRFRSAKSPANLLVAAIEGDYDEPYAIREMTARKAIASAEDAE